MTRKFTPEELNQAVKQINQEKSDRYAEALSVSEKLNNLIPSKYHMTFYPDIYGDGFTLKATRCQYDFIDNDFEILESVGAKMIPWGGKWGPGEAPRGEFEGYKVVFEFYDAHSSGW